MNLEELNNQYLKLKAMTEKFKTTLEQCANDLKLAERDKETAENNLKSATKPVDKKKYQTDLNKAETNIEYIKIQIKVAKEQQQKVQEDIDKIIADVKEIPEVKEQCNRAIDIRTQRQITKFEKQKKEQEEKKENLEQLKNMIDKHPQATMIVNKIENKSFEISKKDSEIKDIEEKIDKLDPANPSYATDKAKLDSDKAKLQTDRKTLIGERQTERDNLKKLFNNPKYNEEIDNLTTRAALDKSIRNCDRLIRRSENKIHDYTYARDSLYKEDSVIAPTMASPSKLEQLKNMIDKHPQATMIVNKIENKSFEISKKDSEIKDIEEKIDKLDPANPSYATDKAKLDSDKAKLQTDRKTLIGERQTERDNLKKLFNNPKYNEEIDNLTTRAALDKSIRNCDRLIRRSENKIHDYTYARDSLYKEDSVIAPTMASPSKWETFKGLFRKRKPGDPSKWESFKSLFTKKPALPAPKTITPITAKSFKDEIKLDDKVMRNEVVKEIYNESLNQRVEDGKNER